MFTTFSFLDLGTPELVLILLIVLLLFGGKKLPELSKSFGQSMKELRKGMSDDTSDKKDESTGSSQSSSSTENDSSE